MFVIYIHFNWITLYICASPLIEDVRLGIISLTLLLSVGCRIDGQGEGPACIAEEIFYPTLLIGLVSMCRMEET
jgi:hypothetical protein